VTPLRRIPPRLAAAGALLAASASGCGGGSDDSSSTAAADEPQTVVRCLNARGVPAKLVPRREQYNIAAVHEIRIPLGTPGDVGDGFVEFLNNPAFAKKVAQSAISRFDDVAAARGTVSYQYSRSAPAATGRAVKACAFSAG
jgi:hypothetical protein